MTDITGLAKARVLHALYHGSKPQGLSVVAVPRWEVRVEHCEEVVEDRLRAVEDGRLRPDQALAFDYMWGHVLKVNITGNEFDPYLYDRDNGEGAADRVVMRLRGA